MPREACNLEVRIQVLSRDYQEALSAHFGLSRFIVGPMLVLLGIAFLIFFLENATNKTSHWGDVTATTLVTAGLMVLRAPAFFLRVWKIGKFEQSYTVRPFDGGIETAFSYGEFRLKWAAFRCFVESDQVFVLYLRPDLGHIYPRRDFFVYPKRYFSPDELEEFGRLVRIHMPPRSTMESLYGMLLLIVLSAILCVGVWVVSQGLI